MQPRFVSQAPILVAEESVRPQLPFGSDQRAKKARIDLPCLAQQAEDLPFADANVLDIAGCGPGQALKRLEETVPGEGGAREEWLRKARLAAIMGNCHRNRKAMLSGISFARASRLQRFVPVVQASAIG